jgi:23S rRNA (guanosine2251-2'-O)-methyltransferase
LWFSQAKRMIQWLSMPEIIVIAHNIRSTHNISKLIISGYSPFPKVNDDTRLPHIADKLTSQIHKTALGAEKMIPFEHLDALDLGHIKKKGYTVIGLEQDSTSILLNKFKSPAKIALLLGEEVNGLTEELRSECDALIEIPMSGRKESFNVSVATGIALYALTT